MAVQSIATWDDRLLLLTTDGLYLEQEGQLARLAGDYRVSGVEVIPEQWAHTRVYPADPDPCPVGSTISRIIVSRQGNVYSLSAYYLGVNEITIANGRAETRRICVPDMTEYITAIDNGPYFVDAAIDGNIMYFVCGPDPMLPDVFPFGGDKDPGLRPGKQPGVEGCRGRIQWRMRHPGRCVAGNHFSHIGFWPPAAGRPGNGTNHHASVAFAYGLGLSPRRS